MENIRILFVLDSKLKDENSASDVMVMAFKVCKQNVVNVSWIKEEELDISQLEKTDCVIMENFTGSCFENLSTTKCARILGPLAVSICLTEGRPIPNFPWPIYNVAMSECLVASSNLPKKTKKEIQQKVQSMGGCYSDCLTRESTHLITDSAKTEKYLIAGENNIRLMLPDWVDAVWETSQGCNVHANDEQFNKFRCPPFQNLVICSTGVNTASKRDELRQLIAENGGTLRAKLNLSDTDILICSGVSGASSEKYKAARKKHNIKCVTIEWVYDSINKGYALSHNNYQVKKSTSTPTKGHSVVDPNFSVMSAIAAPENLTTLEATVNMTNFGTPNQKSLLRHKVSGKEEIMKLMNLLDVKKAKQAGQYLDGCSVYIAGFHSDHRDKLTKILNLSGATRYDDISDRVTHVIVGEPSSEEVKIIKARGYTCSLVSLKWLLDSIDKQQPANEEAYLISNSDIDQSEFSSPLSKKGLSLLKSNVTTETTLECNDSPAQVAPEVDAENDILKQYMKNNSAQEEDTLAKLLKNAANFDSNVNLATSRPLQINESNQITSRHTTRLNSVTFSEDESSQPSDIFKGLKFLVADFDGDETEAVQKAIESMAGSVVAKSFKGICDYAIVPVIITSEVRHAATEIVNDLWVQESLQLGDVQEISYYHRPHIIKDTKPLENCVVTISSYSGFERQFLKLLICALGGISQEQFARITSVAKNIAGSTHLISLEASGKKYNAAIKWGLPVVKKDWLLACAETGSLVSESHYLVGDAKAPERSACADKSSVYQTLAKKAPVQEEHPVLNENTSPARLENVNTRSNEVQTPEDHRVDFRGQENTPLRHFGSARGSLDVCTQVTPVNKIMQEVRKTNLIGTPESPYVPNWMNVRTPNTPYGACICPNPSPNLRKEFLYFINQFPDYVPPKQRRLSTPLSEIKRQLWAKIGRNYDDDDDTSKPDPPVFTDDDSDGIDAVPLTADNRPEKASIDNKLQQLEDMLSNSTNNKQRRYSRPFQSTVPVQVAHANDAKDSEVFTVGWDYRENEKQTQQSALKIFMISGVDAESRPQIASKLERLGASISDLSNYDPTCTHLVCPKPARNEKTLSCVAAGKWILHISYVEKSAEAGYFLDEEEFEFGNPKSVKNLSSLLDKETESRLQSMYWWRQEISKRGYGAFNDMRAIVVASKRDPIVRVVEAGGGVVIDVSPPFEDTVHATHCLLEPRSIASNWSDYVPLAKQGIYCVNTTYISDFLHRTSKDIRDCILPYYVKFYSRD